MTNGLFSLFSSLIANTPPYKKGLPSRKFLSLFLILFLAVGNVWGQEVVLFNTNFTNWETSPKENTGLSDGNTYTLTDGTNAVATLVGRGCKLNDTKNLPTSTGIEGYNTNKFRFGSEGNYVYITPNKEFNNGGKIRILVSAEKTKTTDILGTVVVGDESLGNLHGWTAKAMCDWQEFEVPETISGIAQIKITRTDNTMFIWGIEVLTNSSAPAGGADPVCPETLTISSKDSKTAFLEGDAIELTAALSAGNGDISYQWYKGSVAPANAISGATNAKYQVASCTTADEGDYFCVASKSDCSDAVNADAFTITVAHNPCAMYFWFFNDADQTANGKTNATSVFSNMASGNSNMNGSITIDEVTYNVTRRSGDADLLGRFTVPANKAATFYALAVSSGDGARKIVLTNTATSATYEADVEGGNGSYKRVQIDNIAPGTYTIGKSGGNTRLGMVALKVCDATFRTITLEYADGTTPDGSLSVLDGTTAIQPTDPTWEHHRFDGWYNGATPYDWSANVTGDLTLAAHWTQLYTITYAAGDGTATGDAPTQVDKAEGETFTVAANTFEVAGKDFVKWNDGTNDYVPGATYTVGTDNVVLTAQWKAAADKYTVIFKDGGTELASESVKVGEHPTAEGVESRPLYTLSWKLDEEVVELSNVNGTANQEIILTAVWTPKYATSLDFAAITTAGTTEDNPIVDFLASGNMVASNLGGSEWETSTSKSGYVGYKLKNSGATITFLAQEDKRVTITFGSIAADVTLKKGDETVTISANSGDGAETVYNLDVTTDMVVAITTSNGSTVTLKSITIGEIPTISDDATLKDLKVNGETIDGFSRTTDSYYVEMPYGTQKADLPLVTATANHGKATVIVQNAKDRPDDTRATIKVTAEDGTTIKHYYVYFTNAAKEGVSLIKATHTGATTADVTGYIGGSVDKNTQAGGKLGGTDQYFGVKLAKGTFLAGDVVTIYASTVSTKVQIFSDKGETMINEGVFDGNYYTYTLTEATEWIYLYRTSSGGSSMNPTLGYIEVQRDMAPFIESFVIGDAVGTITNKTIAIEVPASAVVTALEPTIVAWANGGAKVTPTGAQDFTNPVTYKVSSAYAEDGITEYTVTVTKAPASTDATLKTLTINGNALTLVDGVYEYDYELPYGTTTAPEVVAEANDANATAVVTSVSLTEAVITVTAENGATQEYVINFTVSRAISYVIYDGSVQKNIKESGTGLINWGLVQASSTDSIKITTTCNGKSYAYCVNVFASATASDKRYMTIIIPDGYMAKFYLAGATNSKDKERSLFISKQITGTLDQSIAYSTSKQYEGMGMTSDYQMPGTYYLCSNASIRLYELSVLLYPIDYARDVRQGYYGTICLPNKGQMIGAAVYEIAYMDYKDGAPYKIYFDEILNGKMEAGVPYVFLPNEGYNQLIVTYTAIFNAAATDANGLYGFIGTSATDEFPIPGGVGNYIIQNNQYREVLAGADARIVSNRAYIKLSEVPGYNDPLYVAPAPAPGRKRIAMGTTGAQVATGIDQVQGDEVPTKMIINGQLFILRGEKMYDAQGKLVK